MRKLVMYVILFVLALSLTSCEAIGGILRAGFWAGVLISSLLWGSILLLFKKFF